MDKQILVALLIWVWLSGFLISFGVTLEEHKKRKQKLKTPLISALTILIIWPVAVTVSFFTKSLKIK